MPADIAQGFTEPILQDLLGDGATFDASGLTLALSLWDREGAMVATAGKVDWKTASASRARFSPAVDDLKVSGSPYFARWSVTDVSGKTLPFPSGAPDVWTVRR